MATGFEWYDYLIFIGTLVVSLGIGLYFSFAGGKQKTTKEYLMGDRYVFNFSLLYSLKVSSCFWNI